MDKSSANPLMVGLFFTLRCVVPLLVMLGISYLLRKLGLVQKPAPPPADWDNQNDEPENGNHENSGSLAHGKA